jgi:alpha-L-rhamnosidase
LRFAEVLNADGSLYTTNLRKARCTDTYVLRGGEAEVFEPHFTFHGFRYVEITGYPGKPGLDAITGVVVHSDTPPTGSFECSNPMLNQLQHNITWGQRGNFLEVPTDCPQRDERLGWTGDAQVFVRTASYNMDVAGFFTKWLIDLTDDQSKAGEFPSVAPDVTGKRDGGPAWADAGIVCPWTIYLCYGDTGILRRHYAAMSRYITFLLGVDHSTRSAYGDWLNVDDPTPNDMISVAFTAYSLSLMINIAEILGEKEDAAKYRQHLQQVKTGFNNEYVTPSGRLVAGSQTAYVLALHFDLLPENLRAQAVARLVKRIHEKKDHLSTGFVGTPYLLAVLSENGHKDLAYKLLLNKDFPSWGYPITQGSTTMWERWDSYRHDKGFQSPRMNSFNHYTYGAVGDWMYRNITGIDTDAAGTGAGYGRFRIAPLPGGDICWAKAGLRTMYGQISVQWQITEGCFSLEATVPPNTEAEIVLPVADLGAVTESDNPIDKALGVCSSVTNGAVVCQVGSGVYRFVVAYPQNAEMNI